MEMLQNGDLANAGGWTTGANWAIAAGVATHTGGIGAGNLSEAVLIVGQTYTMTLTVVTQTAGNLNLAIGSGTVGPNITAPGQYRFTGICAGSTSALVIADLACDAAVDNVSCRTTGI